VTGTATPKELNARHVKGVKLLFLPSADLKQNLEGLTIEVPPDTRQYRQPDTTREFRIYCRKTVYAKKEAGIKRYAQSRLIFVGNFY
jgi:hypothetical protein